MPPPPHTDPGHLAGIYSLVKEAVARLDRIEAALGAFPGAASKPAPPAFAQPELPGLGAPCNATDLPDGLAWTLPAFASKLPPRTDPLVAAIPPCTPASAPEPPPPEPPKPRAWSNTVKVYDALWGFYGDAQPVTLRALVLNHVEDISKATGGKVGPASFGTILAALVRAGAARRVAPRSEEYQLRAPTDALREAVESVRAKRKPKPAPAPAASEEESQA